MENYQSTEKLESFMNNLGFPSLRIHTSLNHFDFTRRARRILVIGPMGAGKTEYTTRVWRDSKVARTKSALVAASTATGAADRRNVFFVRPGLDTRQFHNCPPGSLPYRGGIEDLGGKISGAADSFALEALFKEHPEVGTWIIDEAAFFDERLVYLMAKESDERGVIFICPTLVLNFRRETFNATATLLLEQATDIFPLSAYCDHPDCLSDGYFSYRYYLVDNIECPALYFDPLLIIGQTDLRHSEYEPNYCTRCEKHHLLPGKRYTYMALKPLGNLASAGDIAPLRNELAAIQAGSHTSKLFTMFEDYYLRGEKRNETMMNSLKVAAIAEKALLYLYTEANLISTDQLLSLVNELQLDRQYIRLRLADCHRSVAAL